MAPQETAGGTKFDPQRLDATERLFWRSIWESVPAAAVVEHGIGLQRFGPVQASLIASLPRTQLLNLVLGADRPGAAADGHLAGALEWVAEQGVASYVPVTSSTGSASEAIAWLEGNGYQAGHGWMKFVRDTTPPQAPASPGVEIRELGEGEGALIGAIGATGFRLPTWGSVLFGQLPDLDRWRCYVAEVDGTPRACAAMLIDDDIAQFGIAATAESARGRGCQQALLARRIADAAAAGCRLLFVETGERAADRPSTSYRNILRAGFEEAYVRPNWQLREEPSAAQT
jgi:GNAT superfamily N-acetyltransferase